MARPRIAAPALIIVVLIALTAACGTGTVEEDVPAVGDADAQPTETTASPEEPDHGIPVRAELVVDGLDVPNGLADLGDGRMLISDQTGTIRVFEDGTLRAEPFLDLSDRVLPPDHRGGQELGLSGFALHPDFAANGLLYVLFTEPDSEHARVDVLAEFAATGPDRDIVDPKSERDLIRLEQRGTVHVGGRMVFGDDGLLYVGLGDGGRPADAQDPETLHGTVIRVDVTGDPYTVPSDNPFADGSGAPEVFAYGFRNPFRGSWDDETGLIIADPKWTEKDQDVHLVANGANAGYPLTPRQVPGSSCYDGETATTPLPECRTGPDGEDLTPPVVEYAGQISIGAVRYRGQAVPDLAGMLIVADWSGRLMATEPRPDRARWLTVPLAVESADAEGWPGSRYVWSLERDATGEVYIMVIPRSFAAGGGVVYRLAPPG